MALAKMDLVHITSEDYKIYEMNTSHDEEQVKTKRERIRRNYDEDLLLSCLDVPLLLLSLTPLAPRWGFYGGWM